jgi:hypothetical protein
VEQIASPRLVFCLLSRQVVTKRPLRSFAAIGVFLALFFLGVSASFAQTTDDDAALQPAEPDYRVINLPTTLRLPLYKSSFELTHRFNGNLRRGDFDDQLSNLFGIDEGAVVGFEYRFAPLRHIEVVAYRTGFDKTIQFHAKWDVLHQGDGMPLSVSPIIAIDGSNNFRDRYAPSIGATLSRQIDDVAAVYVVPMWVHNVAPLLNQILGLKQNTFYVGLGGRLRIRPTVYVSAEVSPRVAGYAPNTAEYGFAIEKRAGAHVFQLNFTNTSLTTFAQTAQGGQPDNLQMGFNLTRKFF